MKGGNQAWSWEEPKGRQEMAKPSWRLYKSAHGTSIKYAELPIISDSRANRCKNVRDRGYFAGSRRQKWGRLNFHRIWVNRLRRPPSC